jgi:exosortase/archaeosortase family protein
MGRVAYGKPFHGLTNPPKVLLVKLHHKEVRVMLLRVLLITLFLTSTAHAQTATESFGILIVRPDGSTESRGQIDSVPVAVPEFSALRRLTPKLPAVQGHVLTAKLALRSAMQHASAWGATGVLNAIQVPASRRGVFIDTPSFTLDVQPWCAGTDLLKALLLVAGLLALVLRIRVPWTVGLLALAAVVALETNILRVAATALTYEFMGRAAWGWKDTLGGVTTVLGIAQVLRLGWLLNRTVRSH